MYSLVLVSVRTRAIIKVKMRVIYPPIVVCVCAPTRHIIKSILFIQSSVAARLVQCICLVISVMLIVCPMAATLVAYLCVRVRAWLASNPNPNLNLRHDPTF